jgi:hypothetical protein
MSMQLEANIKNVGSNNTLARVSAYLCEGSHTDKS